MIENLVIIVKAMKIGFETLANPENAESEVGFNLYRDCSVFRASVSLDSWVCGEGGVRIIPFAIDPRVATDYFVQYLNVHAADILRGMLEMMEQDLALKKDERIKALEAELEMLRGPKASVPKEPEYEL